MDGTRQSRRLLEEILHRTSGSLFITYDIASGLSHLHSNKIVHGDLKGVNILITPDKRACIGDFGLSRVDETLTSVGSVGTVRWISPELLLSSSHSASTASSDVYAYACVCYEIFTGKIPFHELPQPAAIFAILEKKHPSCPDQSPTNCI
ncbi:hypothetical protein E1B28_011825 [Marasmius oreades]|uniref:Protein kinase domain-containing protein n=1 Tax=Marasmius oreades TaxID=181124 RepID=A0A9P7RV37_9AGAR|nr:uncharacterized protein E1B28_011825 [Marasmius oreades]KAG7090225.1 hypothetical protein E1B28_011825 [Marasmius oreades]